MSNDVTFDNVIIEKRMKSAGDELDSLVTLCSNLINYNFPSRENCNTMFFRKDQPINTIGTPETCDDNSDNHNLFSTTQ